MNLYTLGTGSCTVSPTRYNVSTLLEINQSLYLFDAGSPVEMLIAWAGKNISLLRAIFITHMHADHVGGIPNLIRVIAQNSSSKGKTSIFFPEAQSWAALYGWISSMHSDIPDALISCNVSKETPALYHDTNISVGAIPTDHIHNSTPITFSYTMESNEGSILFTGDLSEDLHDYPSIALEQDFDVCVCEATHYLPEKAVPIFEKSRFKQLILTHIHTPWQTAAGETALKTVYRGLPYPVHIAHDGMEYIIKR